MAGASKSFGRRLSSVAAVVVVAVLLVAIAAGAAAWWWLERPLPLAAARVEVSIEPGTTPRDVAQAWVEAGVRTSPRLLYEWFRWSGQARRIRAGSYELERGASPRELLAKMVAGDETLEKLRIGEGWTWRQLRAEIARAPHLAQTLAPLDDAQAMAAVGAPPGTSPEGRFYPDTYLYSRGVSDRVVIARAYRAMERAVAEAWAARHADSPLRSADELLTLASIVEKETGDPGDRGFVAAVLTNRLRAGMPLQSDPTVIYGLGEAFDGNLRRRDLQQDGVYNSYTRVGLPPTPIAYPGRAALLAAARPEPTRALYFVARGDGTSVFSETLDDHARAVNRYQRGLR